MLSTIRNVDIIIVICHVKNLQTSNHDVFIEHDGYYRDLITKEERERYYYPEVEYQDK